MRLQKKRSGNPTPRFKAAPMPPKWRFNGLLKRAPPSYSLHLADKKRAPVTGARSTAPPLTPVSGRRFRAVRAKKAASAPVFIGSRILTLRAKQPRPRRRFNGLSKHTPVPTLPQTDEARPLNLFPSTGIKDTLSPFAPGSGRRYRHCKTSCADFGRIRPAFLVQSSSSPPRSSASSPMSAALRQPWITAPPPCFRRILSTALSSLSRFSRAA